MNGIIQAILNLFGGWFSNHKTETAADADHNDEAAVQTVQKDATSMNPSHALVLPDANFRDWYNATTAYQQHFGNVIVVRSPAGNNLNRYHTITAVKTGGVWFNDDPVGHIRRAYPVVVTIDVIDAPNPATLKQKLDARVATNQRYGPPAALNTRFVLDWPTDSFVLGFSRQFDTPVSGGKFAEGVTLIATTGTTVRAGAAGTVFNVGSGGDYGHYVQVRSTATDGDFLVTYGLLSNIRVAKGDSVTAGQVIGTCASDAGLKLAVQKSGINTGNRYSLVGAVDPVPLFFVNGIKLYTSATSGLNIRSGRGTAYDKVGDMPPDESARPLEPHGIVVKKLGTIQADDQWVNLDTASGVTGFGAAWLLQARSSHSVSNLRFNGVNLDLTHPLGAPDPARLGQMSYVRMAYDVSRKNGSQDLTTAYNLYSPYFDKLQKAGKKVILIYTHQTFGEGAGYVWPQMDTPRWREYTTRFVQFIRQIVAQYKDRNIIAAHQIWNEQDAPPNAMASVTMPAADYGFLMTSAIQAIRAVDPHTPIITGGHTAGPVLGAAYAHATLNVMPSSIRPDGIAFHPYGRGVNLPSDYAIFGHIDESITSYWNVMPGRRLWMTEWGVLNQAHKPAADVNAYAQSMLSHIQARHPEKIAASVWYAWADSMHNGYGLVGANNQPKEPLYSRYITVK